MQKMQKQSKPNDCGLFTIAVCTTIAFGLNMYHFKQDKMREHLLSCFEQHYMSVVEPM